MNNYLFILAAAFCSGGSVALGEPPSKYQFPEHLRLDSRNFLASVKETIAKVNVGMTRKELAAGLQPAVGTMLSPIETYYVGSPFYWSEHGETVYFDFIFQPASMKDTEFATALRQEDKLRREGLWPAPESQDVIRAISKPYRGKRPYDGALEVSTLPPADRKHLQTLKVGMTRREVLRTFDPARGMIHPPIEPYSLRGAHPLDRYHVATVDIAFKPAAMDETTYSDANHRAEWFRDHPWLPGAGLEDTVTDFYKPRVDNASPDEPVIDLEKLAEADRKSLELLKVGMTRKQVERTFSRGGGLNGLFLSELHFLLAQRTARISKDPRDQISVKIDFAPAGSHLTGLALRDYLQRSHSSRLWNDKDIVTGFSRPFASAEGLAID